MASAFAGMFIGQVVRSRMQPEAFRRWFLIAMILLGLYLVVTIGHDRVLTIGRHHLHLPQTLA